MPLSRRFNLSAYLTCHVDLAPLRYVVGAVGVAGLLASVSCTGGFTQGVQATDGVDRLAASDGQQVPKKGLQRLPALDYDNAIHDLTGTTLRFSGTFPADGTVENFDNAAESASLSPAWLARFVDAAVQVGDEVTASADDAAKRKGMYLTVAPCAVDVKDKTCLAQTARAFGRRAWRRTLQAQEIEQLVALAAADNNELPRQVGTLVTALLSSPHFLFRIERDASSSGASPRPLSSYELASRLSSFLWRSTPDAELLAAADDNSLLRQEVLQAQAERMLDDPRAQSLITGFAERWLHLDRFAASVPSAENFPLFTAEVRRSMQAESQLFLNDFILGGAPLRDMLTERYTYLDDVGAAYYGLPKPGSATPVRVQLDGQGPRQGILTHGSMLIAGSTGESTSPIRRGKLIIGQFLCATPPPPPPGAEAAPEAAAGAVTNRQLLSSHTKDPACAVCHVGMDDFGFAYENFDAGGRVQQTDRGQPVDTSGRYMGRQAFENSQQMVAYLAEDPSVAPCFTKMLFTYAMGRAVVAQDDTTLAQLSSGFASDRQNVRHLIAAIVQTKPFRYRVAN